MATSDEMIKELFDPTKEHELSARCAEVVGDPAFEAMVEKILNRSYLKERDQVTALYALAAAAGRLAGFYGLPHAQICVAMFMHAYLDKREQMQPLEDVLAAQCPPSEP